MPRYAVINKKIASSQNKFNASCNISSSLPHTQKTQIPARMDSLQIDYLPQDQNYHSYFMTDASAREIAFLIDLLVLFENLLFSARLVEAIIKPHDRLFS